MESMGILVKRVSKGDRKAYAALFHEFYTPLLLYSIKFTKNREVSEDIVQDFFVDFWEQRAYERITSSSVRGYIFAAVRNRALKLLEKRDVLREADGELPVLADESDAGWLTEEILQAMEEEIEKLPPRMREVLKAVYIDGLSYRETAEKFVISIATVKTLLVNALKRLRKVFSCFPRFFS